MEYLVALVSNRVILCAFFSWFFAQFLKIIINLLKKKRYRKKDFLLKALFGTGGMPSSHTAAVVSVCVAIGIQDGFDSALFALSFLFVFIVVRDATGVRLSSGVQGFTINDILKKIDDLDTEKSSRQVKPVKEVNGHTPLECFVGIIVGIFIALCVYFI